MTFSPGMEVKLREEWDFTHLLCPITSTGAGASLRSRPTCPSENSLYLMSSKCLKFNPPMCSDQSLWCHLLSLSLCRTASSLCYLQNICAEPNHILIPPLSLVRVIVILCPDFCCSLLTGLSTPTLGSLSLFSTLQTQWETFTRWCHHTAQNSPLFPSSLRVKAKVITTKQFYLSKIIDFILATLYNYVRRKQMLNANNWYLLTPFKLAFTIFIWKKNHFLYTSLHCTLLIYIYEVQYLFISIYISSMCSVMA